MRRLFADTQFFIALLSERDADHPAALQRWSGLKPRDEVTTTAWVLIELADGMSAASRRSGCVRFIEKLRARPSVRIVEADPALFWRGFDLYQQRPDKEWSLTDYISFVAMDERALTEALTNDHHFVQAGFVALLAAE